MGKKLSIWASNPIFHYSNFHYSRFSYSILSKLYNVWIAVSTNKKARQRNFVGPFNNPV